MAFLKVAMLKLLFEFDVVTFAQEIMSIQGQLTLSTYDVRLTFEFIIYVDRVSCPYAAFTLEHDLLRSPRLTNRSLIGTFCQNFTF